MKDMKISVCAVLCIAVGLVTLSIADRVIEPESVPISSLTQPGGYGACEGIVCAVHRTDQHTFIHVYDGQVLEVPFFNAAIDISVGELLHVEGMVSEYHGQMQIIPRAYTCSPVVYGVCIDSVFHMESDSCSTSLSDGFHAIVGEYVKGELQCRGEVSYPFVYFSGLITSCHSQRDAYRITLFDDHPLNHSAPLDLGQITGYGIPFNNAVVMLWHQWKELEQESVASARERPEGYPVKICGIVKSVHVSDGHLFVCIEDRSGSITMPIFKDQQEVLSVGVDTLLPGRAIYIQGIMSSYKGEPEILPSVIS